MMPDTIILRAALLFLLLGSIATAQADSSAAGANAQKETSGASTPAASQAGSRGRRRTAARPAPASTGRIEIKGQTGKNPEPTADRPLLPVASLGNALGIRSGTPIRVRLQADADSGHARNGDMLNATLAEPLAGLPVGTPVGVTVVQAARAGQLLSFGELSLQVVSIGKSGVLSDTITAFGKEGPKELPDAAPARGTEAIFPAANFLEFPAA